MSRPNYVGAWAAVGIEELGGYPCPIEKLPKQGPYFHLFFEETQENEDGKKFRGRCLDVYGEARVLGVITPERFKFDKQYTEESMKRGGSRFELTFEGLLKNLQVPEVGLIEVVTGFVTCKESKEFRPRVFVMRSRDPLV